MFPVSPIIPPNAHALYSPQFGAKKKAAASSKETKGPTKAELKAAETREQTLKYVETLKNSDEFKRARGEYLKLVAIQLKEERALLKYNQREEKVLTLIRNANNDRDRELANFQYELLRKTKPRVADPTLTMTSRLVELEQIDTKIARAVGLKSRPSVKQLEAALGPDYKKYDSLIFRNGKPVEGYMIFSEPALTSQRAIIRVRTRRNSAARTRHPGQSQRRRENRPDNPTNRPE